MFLLFCCKIKFCLLVNIRCLYFVIILVMGVMDSHVALVKKILFIKKKKKKGSAVAQW